MKLMVAARLPPAPPPQLSTDVQDMRPALINSSNGVDARAPPPLYFPTIVLHTSTQAVCRKRFGKRRPVVCVRGT